jgi:large subunit ribosomal protein L21
MYAIVATSGKQFRVSEGDRILVDRVPAEVGQTVRLDSVLMFGGEDRPMVGTPFVSGAAVEATVVAHRSGDKIIVFKFEARKRKRRKTGHRQQLSELRIGAIQPPGENPPPRPSPARGEGESAPSRARGEGGSAASPARSQSGAGRTRKTSTPQKTTKE